jgi:Zn-dependent membrane protease YugP
MLYILIIVATVLISGWASMRIRSVYQRYLAVESVRGASGMEVAAAILNRSGIHDVEIVEIAGDLTDHYDPGEKRLALSSTNYHGTSLAAIGVAAHECGHALQHAERYGPLVWRMSAVGITNFASQLVFWIPLLGAGTGLMRGKTAMVLMAACWGILMLFQLVTLPVEFDASHRAKRVLSQLGYTVGEEDAHGVCATLDAAAWTYVAAFISSLAWFLYHALPLLLGGRRDDE